MSEPHDGFLVKENKPHHLWINIGIIVSLVLLSFFVGRWDQKSDLAQSYELIQELNQEVKQLNERNDQLVKDNARLLSDSKVDRDAYQSANDSMVEFQKEIRLLKEELVFYRGIVSPEKSKLGIKVQEIILQPNEVKDRFHYKVVLTKLGKSNYAIKGDLELQIQGLLDGEMKKYRFKELTKEDEKTKKYAFKYFQIFDGFISLPSEFYPEEVIVKVKSKSKKVKSIEKSYNWAELMPGDI